MPLLVSATATPMNATRRILPGLGMIALALVVGWQLRPGFATPASKNIRTPVPAPARVAVVPPAIHPSWSRAEAAKLLLGYYRREQLAQELELEQTRYGSHYWEPEPGVATLQDLQLRREDLLKRLGTEMNALLAEMAPGETGEALRLEPFFTIDRAAPNLGFLSAESRAKMAGAIAAGQVEPEKLLETAREILSENELQQYLSWNAPASSALRNRLVGFEAHENEFNAVLRWTQATDAGIGAAQARAELEQGLGAVRLAEFERLQEPVMKTAVLDLQRLGLPLDQAAMLASIRRQAVEHLQDVWSDPRVPDAQKGNRVSQVQAAYRLAIAAQLQLSTDDGAAAELLP